MKATYLEQMIQIWHKTCLRVKTILWSTLLLVNGCSLMAAVESSKNLSDFI